MEPEVYDIKFPKSKHDGTNESWWITCGKLLIGNEKATIIIDSIPIGFDGKLYAFLVPYEQRKKRGKKT